MKQQRGKRFKGSFMEAFGAIKKHIRKGRKKSSESTPVHALYGAFETAMGSSITKKDSGTEPKGLNGSTGFCSFVKDGFFPN